MKGKERKQSRSKDSSERKRREGGRQRALATRASRRVVGGMRKFFSFGRVQEKGREGVVGRMGTIR